MRTDPGLRAHFPHPHTMDNMVRHSSIYDTQYSICVPRRTLSYSLKDSTPLSTSTRGPCRILMSCACLRRGPLRCAPHAGRHALHRANRNRASIATNPTFMRPRRRLRLNRRCQLNEEASRSFTPWARSRSAP